MMQLKPTRKITEFVDGEDIACVGLMNTTLNEQ
jgi:hypothetical protein